MMADMRRNQILSVNPLLQAWIWYNGAYEDFIVSPGLIFVCSCKRDFGYYRGPSIPSFGSALNVSNVSVSGLLPFGKGLLLIFMRLSP